MFIGDDYPNNSCVVPGHSSNTSGPLSAEAISFIKRHNFSLITLEKNTMINLPPVADDAEKKIVQQARWIKREIPDVPILMYTCSMGWNLAPDEGGYAIYNHLPDRLFLRDKQGKYCTFGKGWKVFDLSQSEMVQRWLSMAQTAKDSGVIDGLFVDSGNLNFRFCDVGNTSKQAALEQAHADLFTEMQKIFGGQEKGGVIISNGKFYPNTNGRMQEGFMAGDSANGFDRWNPQVEVSLLQEAASSNRFIESHGYGGLDPFGGHANHSAAVINSSASVQRAWAQQLAAFLIGAGNTSYFYASDTWTRTFKDPTGVLHFDHGVFALDVYAMSCDLSEDPWGWLTWHDDLSQPLGRPLGMATMSKSHRGVLFKRRYANGVNVSLWTDVGNTSIGNKPTDCTGCICWSDGTITGTCPPNPSANRGYDSE